MACKLTDIRLEPCGDYALNSFLLEINDELTDEDLRKLKFLCQGKYGIKKARLEEITTPLDLFDTLREKELLNEMNIITLQALLWVLPRRDLQRKYVEFAETLGSSIHFVVPRESPENGYKYLKFHIEGADLNKYDRRELEMLRSKIGFLLRVPPEFVIVSGIEPSSSLMITIMLLEDDANRLVSSSPESLAVLSDMFVNYFKSGETSISVPATTKPAVEHDPVESRIEEEAREALLRQHQTERELDRAHDKISKLQSELKSTNQNAAKLFVLLVVIIQQLEGFYNNFMKIKKLIEDQAFNPVDKLQKLCVFTIFRHCLNKVRQLGYKEDVIYSLLDAQALVFQWHNHERRDIEIANLRTALAFSTWEKEKLAYYHRLGVQDKVMSRREEFFVSAMAQNLPFNVTCTIDKRIQLSQECVEYAFRRLSQDVTKSELRILTKQHKVTGHPAKTVYDYLTFLHQGSQQDIDLRSFVKDVLVTPLNRPELLQNFEKYVSEFSTATETPRQSSASDRKPRKQKGRPTFAVRPGKQSGGAKNSTGSSSTSQLQADNFQEIIERLSNIEKSLEERDSRTNGPFNKGSILDKYQSFLESNQLFPPSFLQGKFASLNPSGSPRLE